MIKTTLVHYNTYYIQQNIFQNFLFIALFIERKWRGKWSKGCHRSHVNCLMSRKRDALQTCDVRKILTMKSKHFKNFTLAEWKEVCTFSYTCYSYWRDGIPLWRLHLFQFSQRLSQIHLFQNSYVLHDFAPIKILIMALKIMVN